MLELGILDQNLTCLKFCPIDISDHLKEKRKHAGPFVLLQLLDYFIVTATISSSFIHPLVVISCLTPSL